MGRTSKSYFFTLVRSPSVRLSDRNSSRRDEQALPKSLIAPRLPLRDISGREAAVIWRGETVNCARGVLALALALGRVWVAFASETIASVLLPLARFTPRLFTYVYAAHDCV